jgi:long-chain acyl-CoA synthetase
VPEYGDRPRAEVRAEVEAHVKAVSASLPFHARARVWHVVDLELPRTTTRKVKRPLVREEIQRLEAAASRGASARRSQDERGGDAWIQDLLADVSRRPRAAVTRQARLQADLGFDSLMLTELTTALEEAGVPSHVADEIHAVQTVEDLLRLVAGAVRRGEAREPVVPRREPAASGSEIQIPAPLARWGRKLLSAGQRALYREIYSTRIEGAAFVPRDRNVLVVSNHASHLDMGLVKIALGEEGERLAALAARDYFFDTPLKRAYFENFTNLIPMDREGSLKTSLRTSIETLRRGYHLLIFPEGTRTRDGEIHPFFPTAGYLALTCGVDVLPVYLSGTFEALPPGGRMPKRVPLGVRIGPVLPIERLRQAGAAAAGRSEAYRLATRVIEEAVRGLQAQSRGGRKRAPGKGTSEEDVAPPADAAAAPEEPVEAPASRAPEDEGAALLGAPPEEP